MLPFGETVLAWRLERGMTQAQLARAARIPRPNVSAIERGDRDVTLRSLRALALALDVAPGVLADGVSPRAASSALSRAALERIAAAALNGETLRDAREAKLARQLGAVTAAWRAPAARRRTRRGRRTADRAYFLLKSVEGPEAVASLVSRLADRMRRA